MENASDRKLSECWSARAADLFQRVHEDLHARHGVVEQAGRILPIARPQLPQPHEHFTGEPVEPADDVRIAEAVLQRLLPVADRRDVVRCCGQYCLLRDVENQLVVGRHGLEQRIELQVAAEIDLVRRQRAFEIEIAIPMHEKGFHEPSLSRNCAEVRRYFSATEIA